MYIDVLVELNPWLSERISVQFELEQYMNVADARDIKCDLSPLIQYE